MVKEGIGALNLYQDLGQYPRAEDSDELKVLNRTLSTSASFLRHMTRGKHKHKGIDLFPMPHTL